MNEQAGVTSGEWRFQLGDGVLSVSSMTHPEQQVVLGPQASYDLSDYLYQHRDELYRLTHQK